MLSQIIFDAPETIQVLTGDKRAQGFLILTRAGSLWRPASILESWQRTAQLVPGSTARDNFQGTACYSALYKVPGYPYKVYAFFNARTERIA